MKSIDNIKEGSIIRTSDGILAQFGYSYKDDYGQDVFFSPIANNIDDHLCYGGVFRIKNWRYATEDEKERLRRLVGGTILESGSSHIH